MELTFDQLIEKCKKCSKCRLRSTATQVVPGDGNPKADIMFIGEGPGKNEDIEGVPFCGAAGKFLDELLASIDVKREDVFITNMVRCRPPGNRDPEDDEIQACREWTNAFIKIITPKVFVLLGRFAMAKFFPKLKISQVHGNAYRKWNRLFVIMYHPAVALYNGSFRDTLTNDMTILREILDGDESRVENLDDEKNEIKDMLEKKREEKKGEKSQLGLNL
ncbi:MAG: uracil-DNA glycosylase [Candidatus Dojkabacteria bacterium]|nr:uracil-DNA glycosylase [Candidatus Dojkabacteria bacterium]